MRAIVYRQTGGPEVLELVERPEPRPGPGEVLVRVAVSGVNPTDWRFRRADGPGKPLPFPEVVPNEDGAGTIVAVGEGVDPSRVGERVWIWEAAWLRADGTAQELVALPTRQAVALPDGASFDLGATLGIPALTAHRCLTVGAEGPDAVSPGTLSGQTVLVSGGAGAVGHATIELAKWAGATVVTTVSSPEKAVLAKAAGADHVVDYRAGDAIAAIRGFAADGVNLIVEVSPIANEQLDQAVVAPNGTVAIYSTGDRDLAVDVRPLMLNNIRYQFVLVYTVPPRAKQQAVRDVVAAVAAGALRAGPDAGLPLLRYPLAETAAAHEAVENQAVGKVLVDVS